MSLSDASLSGVSLDQLRQEIDRIDLGLHDLLIERARVVEAIGKVKAEGSPALRPAREAVILRRLADRHEGPLPMAAIGRIWREMISEFTALQGPFAIAVTQPEGARGYWDIARDHYGGGVPMTAVDTAQAAVRLVAEERATVAVVPWPEDDDTQPWWPMLLGDDESLPRVIGRLPFVPVGNARPADRDALVVSRVKFEDSGNDRTLIGLELAEPVSRARLRTALTGAGLDPTRFCAAAADGGGDEALQLVEVAGYHAPAGGAARKLADHLKSALSRLHVIGGYAIPLTGPDRK